jgi:hypothetical protein
MVNVLRACTEAQMDILVERYSLVKCVGHPQNFDEDDSVVLCGGCVDRGLPTVDTPTEFVVYDSKGDVMDDARDKIQLSVFHRPVGDVFDRRINIIFKEGKLHVEQYSRSGDEHLKSDTIDLV